jgi:hypothetical protein
MISVNHRLPSGLAAMENGLLPWVGRGYSMNRLATWAGPAEAPSTKATLRWSR